MSIDRQTHYERETMSDIEEGERNADTQTDKIIIYCLNIADKKYRHSIDSKKETDIKHQMDEIVRETPRQMDI